MCGWASKTKCITVGKSDNLNTTPSCVQCWNINMACHNSAFSSPGSRVNGFAVSLSKWLASDVIVNRGIEHRSQIMQCMPGRKASNRDYISLPHSMWDSWCFFSASHSILPECRTRIAPAARSAAAGYDCLDVHKHIRLLALVQAWLRLHPMFGWILVSYNARSWHNRFSGVNA